MRPLRKISGRVSVPLLAKLAALAGAVLVIWWLAVSSPAKPHEVVSPSDAGSAASEVPAAPKAPAEPSPGALEPASQADPAAPEAPPSAASAPTLDQPKQLPHAAVPQRQGPVDELAKRFASESRGDSSEREDARVKAAFVDPQISSTLLQSVECRRSVCRLQLRWSPEHDPGYVLGLTRAVGSFSAPLGIEEPGPADARGQRPLVVFFGLSP